MVVGLSDWCVEGIRVVEKDVELDGGQISVDVCVRISVLREVFLGDSF